MKRIAIITPCILPVPACRGGAVETLITRLIDDNEKSKQYSIDLFTIDLSEHADAVYFCSKFIYVRSEKYIKLMDRALDKYYRTVSSNSSTRRLDKTIVRCFVDRTVEINGKYDAVIIENMMSTACEIVDECNGKYDFPIYFHMHNDVDIYRSPNQIRKLVRFGVQFIAVSKYIKNQILKYDRNAVVSILYNGINLSEYVRTEKNNKDHISLLYAGRIIPGKGVKELLKAFVCLMENLEESVKDEIKLKIVGFSDFDKGYEAEVRKIAKDYDNIECHGQVSQEELRLLFRNSDIVVMPSLVKESFGLVALETMAMGIPLITTDSGALPEVAGDGACIVETSGDFVKSLSESLNKVIMNKEYRSLLSEKAYERAHSIKAFDIENYYNNFVSVIRGQDIDEDDLISIIVPVYNVEPYLKRCITSIITQTYNNLELILVDDGSTDGSGGICDAFSKADRRIVVIHQENKGLSGARNVGLDMASGKYIFLCDSDDYLRENTLECMLKKLKKDHADIVACGMAKVCDPVAAEYNKVEMFTSKEHGRWSGHESVIQMMRSNNVCSVSCNKLYARELFDGVRFPLGAKNEDEATVYKLLYKAKIVSYMPNDLYMYYQREISIMHEDIGDRYKHFLKAGQDRIRFFHEKGEAELEQHSVISLLEWIKYAYRNIEDKEKKNSLVGVYKDNIKRNNAPTVLGMKKRLALLLWKYIHY